MKYDIIEVAFILGFALSIRPNDGFYFIASLLCCAGKISARNNPNKLIYRFIISFYSRIYGSIVILIVPFVIRCDLVQYANPLNAFPNHPTHIK